MSSNKPVSKPSALFNLDHVDNLVRSSSKKLEKEVGQKEDVAVSSWTQPYMPRLKSMAKKAKMAETETRVPPFKKRMLELLEEMPDFERQSVEYQRHVTVLREDVRMRDELIKELRREIKEHIANRDIDEADYKKRLAKSVEEVTRDASRTILTSRLKMAKEAEDATFNRAEWDIAGWQKALDELEVGMYFGDDDDLALIEVDGVGEKK